MVQLHIIHKFKLVNLSTAVFYKACPGLQYITNIKKDSNQQKINIVTCIWLQLCSHYYKLYVTWLEKFFSLGQTLCKKRKKKKNPLKIPKLFALMWLIQKVQNSS